MINWTRRQLVQPPEQKWLDGHIYQLTPDVDFPALKLGNLRAKLFKIAADRQLHVRTRLQDGVLYVQALGQEYDERPDAELRNADGSPVPSPGQ